MLATGKGPGPGAAGLRTAIPERPRTMPRAAFQVGGEELPVELKPRGIHRHDLAAVCLPRIPS